ncbi:MAG: hypothetical protein K8M05_03260, partial [Deltaproteobacteria bacterium]|nr:hypothetical protein [Kofleriaceae bacterium]
DGYVEAAAGLVVPMGEPIPEVELATSPAITARGGVTGANASAELSLSFASLRREPFLIDQPNSERLRALIGGRLGQPVGSRSLLYVRGAVGVEQFRLHVWSARDPDRPVQETTIVARGLVLALGGGGHVDVGSVQLGLAVQLATTRELFLDNPPLYDVEAQLTVGARFGAR